MTRYEARLAMSEARSTFGMFSQQAIEAEKRLTDIERAYYTAQRDSRDTIAKQWQD